MWRCSWFWTWSQLLHAALLLRGVFSGGISWEQQLIPPLLLRCHLCILWIVAFFSRDTSREQQLIPPLRVRCQPMHPVDGMLTWPRHSASLG